MAEQDPQDFSLFQLVADQLISIVGTELGNGAGPIALGRKLVISDRETNDIHVDPTTIYLNPHYFVSHDQRKIIQGVFALSIEFDSERHKRTLRAINQLSWDLRIAMKRLGELDPKALDIIIREEYLGEPSSEPIHLSIVETEDA